jgi:hypothetical protein
MAPFPECLTMKPDDGWVGGLPIPSDNRGFVSGYFRLLPLPFFCCFVRQDQFYFVPLGIVPLYFLRQRIQQPVSSWSGSSSRLEHLAAATWTVMEAGMVPLPEYQTMKSDFSRAHKFRRISDGSTFSEPLSEVWLNILRPYTEGDACRLESTQRRAADGRRCGSTGQYTTTGR